MSGDIREAFHTAIAEYIAWTSTNEKQSSWGWISMKTMERRYVPEPTVMFFGKDRPISEICRTARTIEGELPPHIFVLINHVVAEHGGDVVDTYAGAVDELESYIELELDRPNRFPISQLCMVDQIRRTEFERGVEECRQAFRLSLQAKFPGLDLPFD